jgi:hypothetical protein
MLLATAPQPDSVAAVVVFGCVETTVGVMLGRIEMDGDATVLPFTDPNVKNLVGEVSCYSCTNHCTCSYTVL